MLYTVCTVLYHVYIDIYTHRYRYIYIYIYIILRSIPLFHWFSRQRCAWFCPGRGYFRHPKKCLGPPSLMYEASVLLPRSGPQGVNGAAQHKVTAGGAKRDSRRPRASPCCTYCSRCEFLGNACNFNDLPHQPASTFMYGSQTGELGFWAGCGWCQLYCFESRVLYDALA